MKRENLEKIHLYAIIKPYDINIAISFYPFEKIEILINFIEKTVRKLKLTPYKIGRVEKKSNNAILLPDFYINEFLNDNEEIIIYSLDYGLTKRKISNEKNIEDIDELYIGKKSKRKNENTTRKSSSDFEENEKEDLKSKLSKQIIQKEENINKNKDSDDDNSENENNTESDIILK